MNRATSAYVEMIESISPVPAEQDNLIKTNFKSCYFPQIHCWLICQKHEEKKRKLFDFLNCTVPLKSVTSTPLGLAGEAAASILRPRSALSKPTSLIYRSLNCTIDFSPTHNQRPSTRRINRNRFSSPGSDEIFKPSSLNPITNNISTSKALNEHKCTSLAQFHVKRLLQPSSAKLHYQIADQYFDLLNELSLWVDKKCNQYPIDDLRLHPTLNPNCERKANLEADRTDHILRQSGPPPPTSYTSQISIKSQAWKTPTTANSSFFDNATSYKPEIISFVPMERSSPFCKFPQTEEKIEQNQIPIAFRNQSLENRLANIHYKNIFQSKTCL